VPAESKFSRISAPDSAAITPSLPAVLVLKFFGQSQNSGWQESGFGPLVSAAIRDSALARQSRRALSCLDRRVFMAQKAELAIERIGLSALAATDVWPSLCK
jgi:hypothetical protein